MEKHKSNQIDAPRVWFETHTDKQPKMNQKHANINTQTNTHTHTHTHATHNYMSKLCMYANKTKQNKSNHIQKVLGHLNLYLQVLEIR